MLSFSGADSLSRTRIVYKQSFSGLQDKNCRSAADRGEILQEDFKRIACFEMFKKNSYRHSRANENRRAARDFRV